MRIHLLRWSLISALLLAAEFSGPLRAQRPTFRKPPPAGVHEVVDAVGRSWSVVKLKDNSLLAVGWRSMRRSTDGGLTWTEDAPVPVEEHGQGYSVMRLKSGALALYSWGAGREIWTGDPVSFDYVWLSHDEGKTWKRQGPIKKAGWALPGTMMQTKSGRLIYPNRVVYNNQSHADFPREDAYAFGTWKDVHIRVSGHYQWPEIDIGSVSYSDDEGRTWQMMEGFLIGWFDQEGIPNGMRGVTAIDEPSVAETADGRLLFLARSTVGRLVESYSSDGGKNWTAVRPSELMSSYSPPMLARIPSTGDLLCVWNQVSREEIRRGYRRGRLSAAISRDSGDTWVNFKTVEVSTGLDDVERIPAEYPTTPVRASDEVGRIPDDFAVFRYPAVSFVDDKVFISYSREWFEKNDKTGSFEGKIQDEPVRGGYERALRIYPLKYFYQD